MIKITLEIDGMMCGMCEAHVNDAIRRDPAAFLAQCDARYQERIRAAVPIASAIYLEPDLRRAAPAG